MALIPQVISNATVAAGLYLLIALGFALVYSTARFFHFAHGGLVALAPYLIALGLDLGLHMPVAAAFSIATTALVGCSIELSVYRPLRQRRSSSLVLLLASLGLYIIVENAIALGFGTQARTLAFPGNQAREFLGARITPVQILVVVSAIALVGCVQLALKKSRAGWALRAVGSDAELARISGIDADRAVLFAIFIGSVLAAVAGILSAMNSAMTPTMGMRALMMAVVVVIISGNRNILALGAGALFLAGAQHLAAWQISSRWQEAIAFVLLFVSLIAKPQGLFGQSNRGIPA